MKLYSSGLLEIAIRITKFNYRSYEPELRIFRLRILFTPFLLAYRFAHLNFHSTI